MKDVLSVSGEGQSCEFGIAFVKFGAHCLAATLLAWPSREPSELAAQTWEMSGLGWQ